MLRRKFVGCRGGSSTAAPVICWGGSCTATPAAGMKGRQYNCRPNDHCATSRYPIPELTEPFRGAAGAPLGLDLGQPLRDDPRPVRRMIEGHDHVIQTHGQRRHLELVDGRRGQRLQTAAQFVAEQAGRAP